MLNHAPPSVETLAVQLCALERSVQQQFAAMDKALELQAGKYDVHLDKLNHEHERVLAAQNRSVSVEVYEAKHEDLIRRLNSLDHYRATSEGKSLGVSLVIGGVVTIISLALHFVK